MIVRSVEKSKNPDASFLGNPVIRRTASLDAIYLKGQWPRGNFQQFGSKLLVDKSTQTPEEWQLDDRRTYFSLRASPSNELWKNKQQRLVGYPQHLTFPVHQYSAGCVSPNRVAASTNTDSPVDSPFDKSPLKVQAVTVSNAIKVPKANQVPVVRSSVEGFSTEIEKLIWRGQEARDKVRRRRRHKFHQFWHQQFHSILFDFYTLSKGTRTDSGRPPSSNWRIIQE